MRVSEHSSNGVTRLYTDVSLNRMKYFPPIETRKPYIEFLFVNSSGNYQFASDRASIDVEIDNPLSSTQDEDYGYLMNEIYNAIISKTTNYADFIINENELKSIIHSVISKVNNDWRDC